MSQPKQVSLMTDQHSSSIATSTVVAESAGEYKIAQPSNEEIQYFANTEVRVLNCLCFFPLPSPFLRMCLPSFHTSTRHQS